MFKYSWEGTNACGRWVFTELKADWGQMSTGNKTFSINWKQSSFFLLALKISSRVKDAKIPSEGVVALLKSGKGGGVVRAVECMVMWSTWSWQKEQPEFVDINPLHPDISIHFLHTLLICFFWYWQEEFIWRSKLLMLAIISFIAMILMNGLTKGWLRTNVHRKQNVLHKLKTKLFLLTGSENIIKGKRRKNSKWGSGCFIEVREGGGGSEGSRVHGNVINVIMAKRTARVCWY